MSDPGSAAGEAGGIIAGAVAVLYALGKGTAWLLNWKDARAQSRAAKLQLWHDELAKREKEQEKEEQKDIEKSYVTTSKVLLNQLSED